MVRLDNVATLLLLLLNRCNRHVVSQRKKSTSQKPVQADFLTSGLQTTCTPDLERVRVKNWKKDMIINNINLWTSDVNKINKNAFVVSDKKLLTKSKQQKLSKQDCTLQDCFSDALCIAKKTSKYYSLSCDVIHIMVSNLVILPNLSPTF